MRDLLIRDFYLSSGLIPVDGFSGDDISSFVEKLNSLPSDERRKATRKFRKFIKKILKEQGLDYQNLSPRQRRRIVHSAILKQVAKQQ